MKMRLKHSALAASIALVVSGAAYSDDIIVNIDAKVHCNSPHVSVSLNAGDYLVTPIGSADGGNYDGWTYWAGDPTTGCNENGICQSGWVHRYTVSSPSFNFSSGDGKFYVSGIIALSHAVATNFSLNSSETIDFYVGDSNCTDNQGGVSLKITEVSNCDPVIYSSADKKITFDTLATELYNPLTDESNGQFALFSGAEMSLKALPGFYDFKYQGGAPSYANEIVSESDNCYPTYSAQEETVHFPKVEVPLVGVLPDGSLVDGPAACYETLFRQSTTQAGVFSLKEVTEIGCE